jgi:hypothetical protein
MITYNHNNNKHVSSEFYLLTVSLNRRRIYFETFSNDYIVIIGASSVRVYSSVTGVYIL